MLSKMLNALLITLSNLDSRNLKKKFQNLENVLREDEDQKEEPVINMNF